MNRSKRKAFAVLAALVLTCFNGCDGSGEVTEETANAAEITETASETTEIKTETEIFKTETAEMTETEAEKEASPKLPKPSLQGFDHRAADYVTALVDNSDFAEKWQYRTNAMVADMNGDGVPEVFLQISSMGSLTEVFTFADGKAVHVKAAQNAFSPRGEPYSSYDGDLPEFYVRDGKKVILANCYAGGCDAGNGGIMEIVFDGGSISVKEICGYSYPSSGDDSFYSYRFGGEEVSEDEYRSLRDNCMSELDYCTDYSVTLTREVLESGYKNPLYLLANAIDSFYRSYDMADGLEFGVELKPVYVCRSNGFTGLDTYKAVMSYDAMGNVSSIFRKHYNDDESSSDTCTFKYEYDDNGRVTKIHGFNSYTPEADYDWSIDYYGNINITRSNYPYTDMDESFYKFVTDEQGRVLEETFLANERAAEIYSYDGVKVGDVLIRWFYQYDSFGNKIYEELDTIIYEAKDSIQDYVETWEYDDRNRLVKHTFSYGCDSINEYFYNDNGDMVELIHTFIGDDELNGGREGVYVTDYYYEKDLKGGVTRRCGRGSDYYDDDIIEDIYYAPVRVVK
ncbi:MAG: hypothetical protein K2J11_09995 [Oscillospiraceae bacterium]|nr:hypothetical protein [Oscillospiraceae bacterium]